MTFIVKFMQTILVLNLGSTSFKYELFSVDDLSSLNKGVFEISQNNDENLQDEIDKIFREILRQAGDVSEIVAIGHRVVHGGEKFFETKKIGENEIIELEKLNNLAPLHNPFNIAGIKSSIGYMPNTPNFAIFDTGFFKDLPEKSKIYPIPYKYYEMGIHKFGFHGISHKFAAEETAKKINKPFEKINIITIHLGGGCSVAAIHNGKPIDTTMGFTPLEGLMMQTRCGDIDPGVITQIFADILLMNPDITTIEAIKKINYILNYESGIKGICGENNYLELLKSATFDTKSRLALDMFISKIKKYIGAYSALLGEVDAIALTGKIGAGNQETKRKVFDKMPLFKDIPIIIIEPHEELEIAREVLKVL
jgi:acetate kinase